MVLWSKSSTLDREIRGSNLGGEPEFFILSNRREELRKMMPRISSRPESDRDRKAEEISRFHRMDV